MVPARALPNMSDELPPDSKGEDPPNEEVDGDRGNQKQHELHDDLGNADEAGYHCGLLFNGSACH